ncbi:barwin-like endoglucanase [Pholiota conissans]|uniref:Barwin-like endoglucanase n=1 Tax=Pholiota conissans TaxID=109636 RepID=A0A9P6CX73_9AGAR|nr:barwin-like endoglucanase [Pholiota conissans]
MHSFAAFATFALSFATSVSSLAVPRATPPKGWLTAVLEPYDTYHNRYMALSCNTQHNTAFFDQCCHPLLAKESLADRPAQCDPTDDEEDLPFCDDEDDTTTAAAPVATPTTKAKPTSTSTPHTSATPTTTKKATSTAAKPVSTPASNAASSSVNTGGFATFFYQNGVAGACGTVHSDNDLIAAIDGDRYGNLGKKSSLCGQQVQITNTNNKKTVTVTIADACPTCKNSNSIDLSEGAFKHIATLDDGMVPITWKFV